MTPAFELWVWTMSNFRSRKNFFRAKYAFRSLAGSSSRTRLGSSTVSNGGKSTFCSSFPSRPGDGPVTRTTSCPLRRWPRIVYSVFSCAPPTIMRVMTWQIFIFLPELMFPNLRDAAVRYKCARRLPSRLPQRDGTAGIGRNKRKAPFKGGGRIRISQFESVLVRGDRNAGP